MKSPLPSVSTSVMAMIMRGHSSDKWVLKTPSGGKTAQKKAATTNTVMKIIDVVASAVAIAMLMLRLTRWLQQLYRHSKWDASRLTW